MDATAATTAVNTASALTDATKRTVTAAPLTAACAAGGAAPALTQPVPPAGAQRNACASAASSPRLLFSRKRAERYDAAELPHVPIPDLSVKDLLSAIPKHCFQRSALHSSLYVVQDVLLMSAAVWAATYIDPFVSGLDVPAADPQGSQSWLFSPKAQQRAVSCALFALYQVFQGLVFTGIWVNAHECGHQAFSTSKRINNTLGFVLHSFLLVPYHAWRISHARHHAATGHLTRDEVFVPRSRQQRGLLPLRPPLPEEHVHTPDAAPAPALVPSSDTDVDLLEERVAASVPASASASTATATAASVPADGCKVQDGIQSGEAGDYASADLTWEQWVNETFEDAPLYALVKLVGQQLIGWNLYLVQNSSGQLHYPRGTNHLSPGSVIFDARHRGQIIASDLGVAAMAGVLVVAARLAPHGWWDVVRYYIVPYMWCNHWLVMITYLQHTDTQLPHYHASEWTFVRGALATIDRAWLGPVGPFFFHGIAETHVAHHVHSKIPHYHAWAATAALKDRLGPYYKHSDRNVFAALWHTFRTCRFVDLADPIAFYRNSRGVPSATPTPRAASDTSDSGIVLD